MICPGAWTARRSDRQSALTGMTCLSGPPSADEFYVLTALLTAQFRKGRNSLILDARSSAPETPNFCQFKR